METGGIKVKIFALLSGLYGAQAYAVILGVLFVCGMGVPIPEDITLIAAGFLASGGNITLVGALLAGFFGVLVGDTILFSIGRKYGRKVFDWPGARTVFTPERVALAEARFKKNARLICFTARFLPGLRAAVFLVAGILRVSPATFIGLDGVAALISVPVWILLGYWFGSNLDLAFHYAKRINVIIIVILIGIVTYFLFRHFKNKKVTRDSA